MFDILLPTATQNR